MNGRLQNELEIERRVEMKLTHLPDYVKSWYFNMKASRKTAATRRDYITKIEAFLSSINTDPSRVRLNEINQETVTNYYLSTQTKEVNGELSYTSDSYQCTIWCCLNCFLEFLVNSGLIERNYIQSITKPKNQDLTRINEHRVLLTGDDFKRILDAVNEEDKDFLRIRDYAIILIFMNTGMRKTALMNIMEDDLNLREKKLVVIDKGNKRHEYILTDKVVAAVKEWLKVKSEAGDFDHHLFVSSLGNPIAPKTVECIVKKYTLAGIGKALSPHKLRSGYCSILYGKTHDIEFVRRCVGHSNATTTQRYIVTNGSEKKKAAEIFDDLL